MNKLHELTVKALSLKTRVALLGAPLGNKNAAGPHNMQGSVKSNKSLVKLRSQFRDVYREVNKTRTKLSTLDDRIQNFKSQGKPIPDLLWQDFNKTLAKNKVLFAKEQRLRDKLGF